MLPFYLEKIMTTPSPYTAEELMETFKQISSKMKADIRVEFDAGRIAGSQYAEVYLGMLTAALQGASQFYLTKDSTWAQYALQEAEIKRVGAQTLLLDEELLKAKISTDIVTGTKDEQIKLVENQLEQGIKQLGMLDTQTLLLGEELLKAKIATGIADTTKDEQVRLVEIQVEQGIKQRELHEAEIRRIEEQTLLLGEELLQTKIATTIADETKDEQILLVENQLLQANKQLEVTETGLATAKEQLKQAVVQTEIVTSTKDEQVLLVENQLEQAVKQLDVIQSSLATTAEQLKQAVITTEIATATKDEQILIIENQLDQGIKQLGMMDSQMQTAAEQLLQAKIQTEVATSTKDEQIKMAEVSLKQQEDALAVSQERHGMNFKPAFTQE